MGELGVRTPKPTHPALPSTLYAHNRLYTGVNEAPECIARVVGGPSRPHPTQLIDAAVTPGQMAVQPDHVSWSIAGTGRSSCPQSSGSRSCQVPCTSCDAFPPPQCYYVRPYCAVRGVTPPPTFMPFFNLLIPGQLRSPDALGQKLTPKPLKVVGWVSPCSPVSLRSIDDDQSRADELNA